MFFIAGLPVSNNLPCLMESELQPVQIVEHAQTPMWMNYRPRKQKKLPIIIPEVAITIEWSA